MLVDIECTMVSTDTIVQSSRRPTSAVIHSRTPKERAMKTVDLKLEVVAVPVADIDRAKRFYGETLGWRFSG